VFSIHFEWFVVNIGNNFVVLNFLYFDRIAGGSVRSYTSSVAKESETWQKNFLRLQSNLWYQNAKPHKVVFISHFERFWSSTYRFCGFFEGSHNPRHLLMTNFRQKHVIYFMHRRLIFTSCHILRTYNFQCFGQTRGAVRGHTQVWSQKNLRLVKNISAS